MTTALPLLAAVAPARRGAAVVARGEAGVTLRVLQLILVAAIPLQRFGVQLGAAEISLGLLVTFAGVGYLAATGRLVIDAARLALFGLVIAATALSAAVSPATASATSFALFAAIYLPFVFIAPGDRGQYLATLGTFQDLVLLCAALGAVQFALQFVVHAPWLFTFQGLLPDAVLLKAFNTAVPLSYGSPVMKSNGFLLLEPSMFSQYLAIALLVEILFFQRKWRMMVYLAVLPLSYSGTGVLLLAAFLPAIVVQRRAWGFLIVGLMLVPVALAFGDRLHLDTLLQRAGELQSTQTSGFARFVSAFWLLDEFVVRHTGSLLFGLGPGSISPVLKTVAYEAHDPTWGKLLFEYGVIGSMIFALFFLACIGPGAPSLWMSCVLLFGFLLFGGMLLDPRLNALLLIFCTLPRFSPTYGGHSPFTLDAAPSSMH